MFACMHHFIERNEQDYAVDIFYAKQGMGNTKVQQFTWTFNGSTSTLMIFTFLYADQNYLIMFSAVEYYVEFVDCCRDPILVLGHTDEDCWYPAGTSSAEAHHPDLFIVFHHSIVYKQRTTAISLGQKKYRKNSRMVGPHNCDDMKITCTSAGSNYCYLNQRSNFKTIHGKRSFGIYIA